ncbi:MAG: hypothetical protein HZC10_08750 [Nitrospirae bacterium]|nr:hypothetical protein [Nitrospirota bacterium]
MIQIILPVSCVTMLKESMESEEIDSEKTKKKNAKVVTIAEVLKFNSLKEDYFASQKKCESSLKKAAGI